MPFLGFFHPSPQPEAARAVLMCPPFGWDDVCSYRGRRDWAEQLSRTGYPALRFDLPGTGDSGGSSRDPGRVDAWTEAVAVAARWLHACTGGARIAAIGIGLGGLLAWRAAAQGAEVDDLVLWAVPRRGRTLVRELRAFAELQSARSGVARAGDGTITAGGFPLTADTAAELETLDLDQLPLPEPERRRILFLERDGIGVDGRAVRSVEEAEAGAEVTVLPGPGYAALMADPNLARPPQAVFSQVGEWLSGGPALPARPATRSLPIVSVDLAAPGGHVRETALTFDGPSGPLFGILSEPVGRPAGDLCAVLLNAGAIRRIGPNRMWVDIARRWAAQGVPALRLDLEGIGDAEGDPRVDSGDARYYVPRFVEQVQSVLDELQARGLPGRFVLAGLCSGAFWSFHGALQEERVSAAVMLNPRVLVWSDTLLADRAARELARKARRGDVWKKLLRGELRAPARQLLKLARPALSPSRLLNRVGGAMRTGIADEMDGSLDRLRDAGKRAVLLFSGNEPLRDELLGNDPARLQHWPNIQLELLPGEDHTLRSPETQARAHVLLDQALTQELDRLSREPRAA